MKTKVTNAWLKEIAETGAQAEQLVRDIKPELFEPLLEVGKWYAKEWRNSTDLFLAKRIEGNRVFDDGNYIMNRKWLYYDIHQPAITLDLNDKRFKLRLATDTEVQEALIKEAGKRGYKEGNFKSLLGGNNSFDSDTSKWYFSGYDLWTAPLGKGGSCIFKDGKWAEIIEEPQVIEYTIQDAVEALKQANPGKRITIEL